MRIEIENTSSPGASFTNNTNDVLLKINDWINEHKTDILPFKEFRMILQRDKGINDNNSRNIYPLLKHCELIQYENRGDLTVSEFFTKRGKAYVTALEAKRILNNNAEYTDEQKRVAAQKFDAIISEIIRGSFSNLLKIDQLNYIAPLKEFMAFLLEYKKIDKTEFAYYLFERKNQSVEETLKSITQNIADYREGKLQFEINVSVRNDIALREKTNAQKRNEGLSFLTSFTYFSSLLQQADIVFKENGYFVLKDERYDELVKLLEV